MARVGVPVSPWTYTATDYRGGTLSVTAVFTPDPPHTLITVTLARSLNCVYGRVYFGLGGDGTPDSAPAQFYVPPGGTIMAGAGILAGHGFITAADLTAGQITAGP